MENESNKQTAVEWLWEQIDEILPFSVDTETGIKLYNAKEQAKQMEKEQICKFAYKCHNHYKVNGYFKIEEYFEEKYGKTFLDLVSDEESKVHEVVRKLKEKRIK
jgi:hypothetical protein